MALPTTRYKPPPLSPSAPKVDPVRGDTSYVATKRSGFQVSPPVTIAPTSPATRPTPSAQINTKKQVNPGRSDGNPFAAMLTSVMGAPPTVQTTTQDEINLNTGTTPAPNVVPGRFPWLGTQNAAGFTPQTNFNDNPGNGNDNPGNVPNPPPSGTPGGDPGGNTTGNHPNFTPQTDPDPYDPATHPPPQGWTPQDWATALSYVAGADAAGYGQNYQWLLGAQGQQALQRYHRDAENLSALGIGNVNFTDWARMAGYDSPIDRGSFATPSAAWAQHGGTADQYQTYAKWMAEGAAQFGVDAMRPYAQLLNATPGFITSYMYDMQKAAAAGVTGIHFVDWLKYQNGAPSPLAGQVGQASSDAMARWWALDHGGTGTQATPPPSGGAPPGTSGGQPLPPPAPTSTPAPPPTTTPPPATTPPPTTTPPPATTPPASGDPTVDFQTQLRKSISDYEAGVDPLHQSQREDIARRQAHLGSLTGAINSGGFGETMGDALAQQYAQENATDAPQIASLTMAAQANALQKFSIDMNAILQREQISTNADLERSAQVLQRYGIDQNVLLDRYKAELGLKGIQYSSDRQLDAAALQAAAAHAAAAAQADASKYATDMRYRTDLFQGDVTRENNIMQYILGISALGPEWARLILGSDPFGILTGNPPSGQVIVNP